MARIHLGRRPFAGELPAINPFKLPEQNAAIARNVKFWSGSLEPLRGLASIRATQLSDPATVFRYSSSIWLEFEQWHDVARSPAANDSYGRVYFVGPSETGLRVTDSSIVGGTPPYPAASVLVGVPAPTVAPTVSVTGTGSGTAESRVYVYTAVNAYGEEGPPSPVSDVASVQAGQTAELTLTAVSAGDYKSISKYYVYRSNNGGESYQYVGETATTSYNDSVFTLPPGQEELPSAEWDAPPTDIEGIVVMPNGVMAGFRRNEVLFSEPGLPHAWPVRYRVTLEYEAVRLGLVENGLAVLTDGQPYLVVGTHPGSMVAARLQVPYKCEAARGAAQIGTTVIYPAPRGLIAIDATGARVVSDLIFDDDGWREVNRSSFIAFHWRGLYVCFYAQVNEANLGFLFNVAQPDSGIVTFEGAAVTAGYEDLGTGQLFVVVNSQIQEWDSGAPLTLAYRARPFELARPEKMAVLQVAATDYPVTVAIYRDDELQDRLVLGENLPRRIAGAQLGRVYEVEVLSQHEVRSVVLASSVKEISEV